MALPAYQTVHAPGLYSKTPGKSKICSQSIRRSTNCAPVERGRRDEYSTEWSGCGRLQGPQFIIRAFLSHLRNFLTNLPASAPQFVFISLDSGSYQSPHLTPALLDFIFVLYDLENAGSLTHASYRPPRESPGRSDGIVVPLRSGAGSLDPHSLRVHTVLPIVFSANKPASQRRTPLGVMVPCWLEGSDGCLVYPVVVYVAHAVYATTTESELLPDTPDSKNPDQNIINPLVKMGYQLQKNPFTGAMEPSRVATAWIDPPYLEIGSTTAQYHSARFNIPLKCGWVDISSNGSILRCFVADWIMSWVPLHRYCSNIVVSNDKVSSSQTMLFERW
ncbi:hypothetical protein C8J57DRAFT_1213418 [Mycena rebaudengoi]|nr:hypothetical protein C8J57DRAFT_1213418 [Mycena rebaudengoi]